jgi:hypothetical protein
MVDLTKKYSHNKEFPVFLPDHIYSFDNPNEIAVSKENYTDEILDFYGWKMVPDEPSVANGEYLSWDDHDGVWNVVTPTDDELRYQWYLIRMKRDELFSEHQWRVRRYLHQVENGETPVDNIVALDEYFQALRLIPQSQDSPWAIDWPIPPDNPLEEDVNY